MRAITQLTGPRFDAPPSGDRGETAPVKNHPGRWAPHRSIGAGDIGRFGSLGQLWADRGVEWAEAVRIRQADRQLARLAERIESTRVELEQVKLYPPYPADEPRRAEAIREFNGIAAEVRRLASDTSPEQLAELPEAATTSQAEAAIRRLAFLGTRLRGERAVLASKVVSGTEVGAAEAASREAGRALGADEQISLVVQSAPLRSFA